MANVDIKYLVDLYQRAKRHEDTYVLKHAEAAIEAARDAEAALRQLAVAEAVVEEAVRQV